MVLSCPVHLMTPFIVNSLFDNKHYLKTFENFGKVFWLLALIFAQSDSLCMGCHSNLLIDSYFFPRFHTGF